MVDPTPVPEASGEQDHTPSPFRDLAEEEYAVGDNTGATLRPRKSRRKLWITLLAVAALALFGAIPLATSHLLRAEKTPTPSPSTGPTPTPTVVVDSQKPLLKQYPTAPVVHPGSVVVTATPAAFTTSDKSSLALTGGKLTKAQEECAVLEPTDFCLAGIAQVKTASYNVYYLKDAAHSRLFEAPTKFTPATVRNSPSAGVLPLNSGGATTPALVIVNKNSSGWMLVSADGKSKVEEVAILASVK